MLAVFRLAAFKPRAVAEGVLTLLPGGLRLLRKGTQGTDSARYCFTVWMRHMARTRSYRAGGHAALGTVLELGPGDSLGTGFAALLAGAEHYWAIDAVQHADPVRDQRILDELAALFAAGDAIPDAQEFPDVKPLLPDYSFPAELRSRSYGASLERMARVLRDSEGRARPFAYLSPEVAQRTLEPGSVDLIFSQAVLEHVDDLPAVYQRCHGWLRPGGLMSHQVDFKSHGVAREWNGHWAYPDAVWRLVRGRRRYLLNRAPCSVHLDLLRDTGFAVLAAERSRMASRLRRDQLAPRFREMSDEDLTTAGCYFLARKPEPGEGGRASSAPKRAHGRS